MSIRQDIGPVSAYALAKEKGYQGTEEEFEQAMANVGTNIGEIKEAIDTFNDVTVPTATQSITNEGNTQVGLVNAAGTAQVEAVEEKGTIEIGAVEAAGTAQVGAVNSAGSTQVGNVNTAGSTQVNAVNGAGTTQVGNVNTAGGTQVAAVQAKGDEVIASIPEDYSDLTQEVSDLNQALNNLTNKHTLIDLGNENYDLYSGTDYPNIYVLNFIIPAAKRIALKLNVYQACDFFICLIDKESSKVVYRNTYSLTEGVNDVVIDYITTAETYVAIDQFKNKILFTTASALTPYATAGSYPNVGDTVNKTAWVNNASFAISIYYFDDIETNIDTVENKLDEYELSNNNRVTDIDGYETLYDNANYIGGQNGGNDYYYYLLKGFTFNIGINAIQLKVKVVANCTFHYAIIDTEGNVNQVGTFELTSGLNDVSFVANCEKPSYLAIDGEDKKIYYWDVNSADAPVYVLINKSGRYLETGDTVSTSATTTANFSITVVTKMLVHDTVIEMLDDIDDLKSEIIVTPYTLKDKIIFLAGDSRSSTDYTFYKTTLEKKTNATALVQGASGRNVAYNASNEYFNRLTSNPHDFSLWIVGGNDTGASGTIGTFSSSSPLAELGESVVTETDISADYNGTKFIQAVDHMMRKYKALFYNFKTLNNGHKPKMIFCTDLPQKRDNAQSAWSNPANWERKRLAILECCEKNNVACLDLYELCNFDMSYEPYWVSPTDKIHDNGLYFMDGLHPNQYGIDIITSLEIQEMMKYIMINPYPES